MLSVSKLAKYFGGRPVFQDVSLTVGAGEKIGVIGRNGAGKSTLLRCLAGLEEYEEGEVFLQRGARLGYVSQRDAEALEDPGNRADAGGVSVEGYALAAFTSLMEQEAELRELEGCLAQGGEPQDAILARYGDVMEAFERAGGYDYRARTRAVLAGLGFGVDDMDRDASRLSGGERVRLVLARLLLSDPDLLLLDEPTNHLDIEAVEWLEGFLQRFSGGVIVVSHDRTFLDRVTQRTWEVANGAVADYPGAYTRALALKEQELKRRAREYEAYAAQKERLEAFVARFRAGTRARQAQDRLKKMQRMQAPEPVSTGREPQLALRLQTASGVTGRTVCSVSGVAKAFPGSDPLFTDVDLHVRAGDRIALAGANGAGKSTLLRILVGELLPDEGTVEWASRATVGYFSQHREDLAEDATVLETVRDRFGLPLHEARSVLAAFLFSGDQVEQPVRSLSGGERSRLALLLLVLSEPDVLVLDEPTNHLDLPSRTVLEETLRHFNGTIIAVSHDRYFLDSVTQRTWLLDKGRLTVWDDTLSAVRDRLARSSADAATTAEAPTKQRAAERGRRALKRAASPRESDGPRREEWTLEALTDRIVELEEEKEQLGDTLSDAGFYRRAGDEAAEAVSRLQWIEAELTKLYGIWDQITQDK